MKNETFGSRLLTRRKQLKLSQAALGKLVGVAHVTISQWERDETQPAGKRLFSLSEALQCSPTWLLFGDDNKQPDEPVEIPTALTDIQQELLKLFDALPESEQQAQLSEMRARVENFNKLFEEMLEARKRSTKAK